MSQTLNLQDFAIVVAAKNHSPLMLNLEFLKCSGVLPADWQLMRSPVFNAQASQLTFQNQVSLVAQANQIVFMEALTQQATQAVAIADLAERYVDKLPHANYQAVGFNFRGYVPFAQTADAEQFMAQKLLASGAWQQFGNQSAKAAINFAYTLEGRRLLLSIHEATLRAEGEQSTSVILFSGNFEYRLEEETEADRTTKLMTTFKHWQADLEVYTDLITNHFLASQPVASLLIVESEPELLMVSA